MKNNRAYSLLEIKAVDQDKRLITGIASTPTPDRMNDIIELDGMDFKTPLPFLWQHNARQPIGHVMSAKKTKHGLEIVAKIADDIAPYIGEAWALIKSGLVQGLSIGFRAIEEAWNKETGGFRFIKTELYEISAVTIPANAEASILTVKSLDTAARAALGTERNRSVTLDLKSKTSPGVTGSHSKGTTMTYKDQIAALEAKRKANDEAMDAIMEKAASENRTRDASEQEEYDTLAAAQTSIESDIKAYQEREKSLAARATPVKAAPEGADPQKHARETRQGGSALELRSNAPKGIGMARMAIAMVRAGGNPFHAMELAKAHWGDQSPEVVQHIKTVVEAGDTTTSGWASQLVPAAQQMNGDFLDMLRPATIIGKIPLKKVPFNVSIPLQSGGGTYGYVGEGAPKPVTSPTYGSATLRFEKAAGIIVITEELARFSNPSAELLIRDEMIQGMTRFFDTVFVSSTAAVTNVSPAGILNGISATASTGTTALRFRYDMNVLLGKFDTNGQAASDAYLLMSSGIAMALGAMVNALGQSEFPTITATGGNYLGIPIIVSKNVGNVIILLNPNDILLAEDPAVRIDVSREASVEMDTAPAVGEQSPVTTISTYKSFFQNNLVGIRAEQFKTWKVARTSAVEYLSGASYTPPTS